MVRETNVSEETPSYGIDVKQRKRIWEGLVMTVERACEEFEIIQEFQRGNMAIARKDQRLDYRSTSAICAALARSFLFDARRIERICNGSKNFNIINRYLRKEVCGTLKPFISVRDVNEHGYDPNKLDGDKNTPKMHVSVDGFGVLDETSFIFCGAEMVLMGPINMYDAYIIIKRLNKEVNYENMQKFDNYI